MEHGFLWYSIIPLIKKIPNHIVSVGLVFIVLLVLSIIVRIGLKKATNPEIPDPRLSIRNIFELAIEGILELLKTVIGKEGPKFLPLIGSTFIFIFVSNVLGIIPGFVPPTDNVNTNAACALVIFLAYNYYGLKANGIKYLKHFTGPFWWLAILFIPIEIISHLARPFSLSLRLYGNMLGDHTVLGIFSDLVPPLVPIIFLGLGLFVSFIQAFIFSMLSMLYIGQSISHEH